MNWKMLYRCAIIAFFVVLLGIPIAGIKRTGGETSEEENRHLAELPAFSKLPTSLFNRAFMEETEAWLNDHIGYRQPMRRLYAFVMHDIFRISSNKEVLIGRDGWYYFTKNNNLDIVKGTYPLTNRDIEAICSQQQTVNEYYSDKGVRYLILLTPSKASIYEEYLPVDPVLSGAKQPAEVIEQALKQNGLEVLNIKEMMLSNKENGLFFKTDTHWNQKGTYYAYRAILQQLLPSEMPVKIKFKTSRRTGDLTRLLGLTMEQYKEIVPIAEYDWHSKQIPLNRGNTDEPFEQMVKDAFSRQKTGYYAPEVFVNDEIDDGVIIIYGDSMAAAYLNLPRYLAEHFHKVIVLRLRNVDERIDQYIKPDIVIYQTTERLIKNSLQSTVQRWE